MPIPAGLDEFQCMAIGTAGYTAALAMHRMEQNGQQPDGGEIVVTVRRAASAVSPSTCLPRAVIGSSR